MSLELERASMVGGTIMSDTINKFGIVEVNNVLNKLTVTKKQRHAFEQTITGALKARMLSDNIIRFEMYDFGSVIMEIAKKGEKLCIKNIELSADGAYDMGLAYKKSIQSYRIRRYLPF